MPRQRVEGDARTLHARVLTQIRNDIVNCQLMPNERLTLEALRKRYPSGESNHEALMYSAELIASG
jgi:DNA-binding GntR family transcriptional regulator